MLFLAASLFFTNPYPLDMPRASAYLVREEGRARLEDRYDVYDLWQSKAVLGRWEDDDGRTFTLSRLDVKPPIGPTLLKTRIGYAQSTEPLGRKDDLRPSLELLTSGSLSEEPRPPRQMSRGFRAIDYWQHPTNQTSIICTFYPEKGSCWYLATWNLVQGDDFPTSFKVFEECFLDAFLSRKGYPEPLAAIFDADSEPHPRRPRRRLTLPDERELLRADARHSVSNYVSWQVVDATEFTVLSDLPRDTGFMTSLTNDLRVMRARYAEVLPTEIDGTNVLCVARIFATRDEYLDAVDEDMSWTAAYWSPLRRELVAYLPAGGEKELLRTIRHEAFHQYLSYATSMISVSPWLNEGYAQYFEDESSADWKLDGLMTPETLDQFAKILPTIFPMDYTAFYAGTDRERRLKYRLAWSVAYFLEKGANKVRFQPFKDVKKNYLTTLFRRQGEEDCMTLASSAAFGSADNFKLFVSEWKKFWKEQ